jgi:threonine dehydratase
LGRRNFERLLAYGLPITLVDEEAIDSAMRLLWACLKLVVEPSGAVAFAAVLRAHPQGRIGIVLSGGNVELELWGQSKVPE